MIKKTFLVIFLLIQFSIFASAQQDTIVILPGSKLVNGSIIKPYTNKWKLQISTPEGKVIPRGVWTDYGQIIELENKKYFHRIQDLYGPDMNLNDTWTNMVELETLIPVRFSTINPTGGFSYYIFEGNKITGTTNLNVKEKDITIDSIDLDENVFDWNLYGMLLVGLPLKNNFIAKLPFYDSATKSLQWLAVHVKEQEQIVCNNHEFTTWKIDTNKKLTFWISETAPYVIKLELELKDKAKLVWEVF